MVNLNSSVTFEEIKTWLEASEVTGWGYAGSDGDNVWFLGIKE